MKTLVLGASGATGRLLVEQLLTRGHQVKIVVRSTENLPENVMSHEKLFIVHASVLELSDTEMAQHVSGCDAMVSCLGHNLTFKGMFWPPRKLVTDATHRIYAAVRENKPIKPVKFLLMNTAGNSNRDLDEKISFGQKIVIGLLRLLLPPHVDNEKAADYLRTQVRQNSKEMEWVVIRPDNLINESEITEYEVHPSPMRSAIFDAGVTSRINVGCFMADLIGDDDAWNMWKGKMPVIYNRER